MDVYLAHLVGMIAADRMVFEGWLKVMRDGQKKRQETSQAER